MTPLILPVVMPLLDDVKHHVCFSLFVNFVASSLPFSSSILTYGLTVSLAIKYDLLFPKTGDGGKPRPWIYMCLHCTSASPNLSPSRQWLWTIALISLRATVTHWH